VGWVPVGTINAEPRKVPLLHVAVGAVGWVPAGGGGVHQVLTRTQYARCIHCIFCREFLIQTFSLYLRLQPTQSSIIVNLTVMNSLGSKSISFELKCKQCKGAALERCIDTGLLCSIVTDASSIIANQYSNASYERGAMLKYYNSMWPMRGPFAPLLIVEEG
jgi:hypothetical protein